MEFWSVIIAITLYNTILIGAIFYKFNQQVKVNTVAVELVPKEQHIDPTPKDLGPIYPIDTILDDIPEIIKHELAGTVISRYSLLKHFVNQGFNRSNYTGSLHYRVACLTFFKELNESPSINKISFQELFTEFLQSDFEPPQRDALLHLLKKID